MSDNPWLSTTRFPKAGVTTPVYHAEKFNHMNHALGMTKAALAHAPNMNALRRRVALRKWDAPSRRNHTKRKGASNQGVCFVAHARPNMIPANHGRSNHTTIRISGSTHRKSVTEPAVKLITKSDPANNGIRTNERTSRGVQ